MVYFAADLHRNFQEARRAVEALQKEEDSFAILPDEVVQAIFKYAVRARSEDRFKRFGRDVSSFINHHERIRGILAAVKLSHICQRLRAIALASRKLWSYVWEDCFKSRSERSLVSLERHQQAIDVYTLRSERFFSSLLAHAHRWRTLVIDHTETHENVPYDDERYVPIGAI